jgi:uncharacterized protein (TIGR00255 family)
MAGGSLTLDIRSVNSRFLDLSFRIPDELRSLEPQLRERITETLTRGKVDCRLQLNLEGLTTGEATIDGQALRVLADLAAQVRAVLPEVQPLTVAQVLGWPGVIAGRGDAMETLRELVPGLMREALADLVESRRREGERLGGMIRECTARIREGLARIAPLVPQSVAAWQARITERLREAMAGADEERIRQEVALFGIKVDVAEEFSRLAAHLDEVDRLCASAPVGQPGSRRPVGKRLDFLMQELNRETNTLGSKAVAREITDTVVDFKVLIEQMREQVQNIE